MKITELISIFKKLLPLYKEAYNDNWSWTQLYEHNLNCGICLASRYALLEIFIDGYYRNLVNRDNKLFRYPNKGKDLKSRIDFMEYEIKSLKKLQKKGYTHI